MYAIRYNHTLNYSVLSDIPDNWRSSLAQNINDTFRNLADMSFEYRDLFIFDDDDRILGADEIASLLVHQPRQRNRRYMHGHRPKSHTHRRSIGSVRYNAPLHESIERQIADEWGMKTRRRFSDDTWDGFLSYKHKQKSHRRSSGWKNQKHRHQWEHNLPKI